VPQLFMSCMDRWGIFVRLPTLLGSPSIPCFLFEKHMSLKIQGGIVNINEYHDNSTEYNIDARGKDLASVMRALETEDITPAEPEPQPEPKSPKDIWGIPQKGKYNQVREYIKDRKKGDPEFKEYCQNHSLREICAYLTDEFGWDVDEHSLGANLNRNRSIF